MRVDFIAGQSKADELQQYLRLARITRGVIGAVIIGAIGFMVAALQSDSERGLHDASVNEKQLYAVPAEEGMRDIEPAPSARAVEPAPSARAVEPTPTAGADNGTSGEELRSLTGVVHHG